MSQAETSFLEQRRRNPRFMLIALALTAVVIGAFFYESHLGFGKRPQNIIYVESWPANRSAADTKRAQAVGETARQAAIAQFEIERGQALLSRATTAKSKADAAAHVDQNRAALARWTVANIIAKADLAAHPAPSLSPANPTATTPAS